MLLKYFRLRRAKTSWNRHRSLTCQCVNRSNNSMINREEWDLSNNSCLYDVYIIWVDIVATVCWVQGGVEVWQLPIHVATTSISLVARFVYFTTADVKKNAVLLLIRLPTLHLPLPSTMIISILLLWSHPVGELFT